MVFIGHSFGGIVINKVIIPLKDPEYWFNAL